MKNKNQAQKRSVGSNALIIVLILIILATSAFGIFAWARYQTSVEGEGTAQVAKWSFKVAGDKTQTEQIAFPISRTDTNDTVVTGTIAPGTYGEIPIEIDVTGTQTDLVYTISGSIGNLPRNLKLYYDSARTQEMVTVGQTFSKGNYLKVADIGTEDKVITETIYWEWPFETGTTADEIKINNQEDTEDMGKAMTMALTVSGKQLNGAPALADLVQVGDFVNYNADSNETQTFTSSDCLEGTAVTATISTAEQFNSAAKAQWRVLRVDKTTGIVELMAADPTTQKVKLTGIDGYANAETVLNNIGKIYDDGKGAIIDSGRSINIEDVEQYSSYVKEKYNNGNYQYGDTETYTFSQVGNTNVNLGETEMQKLTGSVKNPATIQQTYYIYSAQRYYSNSAIYDMIFKNSNGEENTSKTSYWLASRCVILNTGRCDFCVRNISSGSINSSGLYHSKGGIDDPEYRAVPVISLQSNIKTTGQNADGVWEIVVD